MINVQARFSVSHIFFSLEVLEYFEAFRAHIDKKKINSIHVPSISKIELQEFKKNSLSLI